ncbi:Transposase [Caligus rogercresseyi]|uniref:Transposase n=1 Tax=Caligus rogercresseyi TaxID=217165 RepID=A0A7T8K8H3_CALRO|nr:Transposase [Caligus rogercresseyi]
METPDFRSYFLIRFKLARTINEIHRDLLSTFPDSCPGLSTLQRWHTEFDKGVFALEKKTRPGRPRETRTEENVARVKRLVEDNPRMTTRQVDAEVSLPSTTVSRLLTEDLGLRNLLSVLVPHQLSEANKTQRVKCCQDLLKLFQDHGEDFLGSHLLVQDTEASLGGAHGGPVLDPPCETDSEEDDDSDGVHLQAEAVSITALPAGTTADRNTMIEYLRTTGKRFFSLKKDKIRLKDCLLMWDNARPHTATDTREFLTRRDVEMVKQSPYSPDLNLCDRFLFRKDEFGGHEEATLAVQRAMRRVSEDKLYDQLRKLRGHCHDVIAVGGDYVY